MKKSGSVVIRFGVIASILATVSAIAAPDEAAKPSDAPVQLDTVVVEAKKPNETPELPSALKIDGTFGDGRALLDTPRSVTPISKELIDSAALVGLRDLTRVAPNTYGPNTFGASSLPTIRGQFGEIFQDGLRRQGGNNGLGLPLSFNSVEQIDVVKGPPPVVLGSTQRVGGFINLSPKRPDLKDSRGSVSVSGGTWDRYRQQFEYSTPLQAGRSGVLLSVETRDEDSFYDYAQYESRDLYAAYRLSPSDDTVFDLSVEYFDVDFTDIAGFNRPTQDLIDRGIYITGQGVQQAGGPTPGSTVPAGGSVVSPTGTVRIPRHRVLTDPDDINGSETVIANARFETRLGEHTRLASRGVYQYLEREEIAQNSFVEIIDGADSLENRTELLFDYALPLFGLSTKHQTDVGVDLRYHDILGYSQFNTEADNPIDLTGPIENRRIPLTAAQQARLAELRPGLFVSPGANYDTDGDGTADTNFLISDTTDSTTYQYGLFVQQDMKFTEAWSLLLGARGDWYDVTARDPLAPDGVKAAEDSITEFLKSGNASLTFKPTPAIATYATASYSQSTSNSLGGGFVLGGDNRISEDNFSTDSRLYELGVKIAPSGAAWYADAAVFDQTRALRNRGGSNSDVRTKGVEAQGTYKSGPVFASLAASYLDARFDGAFTFQDTRTVNDAFDNSRPDIVEGTCDRNVPASCVGSPSFYFHDPSNDRVPALPRVLVSAYAGYEFPQGLGLSLNGVYTDSFPLDVLGTVVIPSQHTINAAAHYNWRAVATDIRLDVFNLTDEENFTPVFYYFFGSTLVLPDEPVNVMVSIRHRF
ncbi:MAG: TonB-dependent receptor [Panacagrimonas sp.]